MQLTVILAVMLAMLVGYGVDLDAPPSLGWHQVVSALAGVLFIAWAMFRWSSQRLLKYLVRQEESEEGPGRLPGRVELGMRALNLAAFVMLLIYGGWADWVVRYCQPRQVEILVIRAVILIGPFVLLELLRLWCFYPVNRHIREHVVFGQLSMGLAARPVWSRGQYMLFNVRHGVLILLLPILCMLALQDVISVFGPWLYGAVTGRTGDRTYEVVSNVASGGAIVMVFVLAPFILRLVWQTRALPSGPLRRKLESFCRRLSLRHRDILLWDTYSAVGNAAVMGVWGKVRYVLLSDALIENMPDEQIEAVFGHEAGHVRYWHIPFLVGFVAASSLLAGAVMEGLLQLRDQLAEHVSWVAAWGDWMLILPAGLLGIGWLLLFGWVSRRFERQADVYGAMAAGALAEQADNNESDDESEKPLRLVETDKTLSQYGAAVMAAALRRIALLNGVAMEARSWRHSSISSRMKFLQGLAQEPGALGRFMRLVVRVKVGIILALAAGIVVWVLMYKYVPGAAGE
ncbi:MAG: M48 family metalloprotease [Sedimentisphaerales bacterium]|nr:M48 family metalloprotease [Sedimentisphaerales bacterium]